MVRVSTSPQTLASKDRQHECRRECVVTDALTACVFLPVLAWSAPVVADEILAKVAQNSAIRHETAYSGWRKYSITNQRFGKSASATVRMTSEPGQAKQFTTT